MQPGKKIYLASDFHLGVPDYKTSLERELRVIRWLDEVKHDAQEIYLLGDVFDFWFEYGSVIPKGYVRLLGKLAELSDAGIKINIFTGNHDMWMFGYLEKEIGARLYREPVVKTYSGKSLYIGHGDGLGPGDRKYKMLKKIFSSKLCQFLFRWMHPDIGMWLGNYFSSRSRKTNDDKDIRFLGEDREWLVIYAKEILQRQHYDYFIFGHRHLPLDIPLNEQSRYINLGEWLRSNTYAAFDGTTMELKTFEG